MVDLIVAAVCLVLALLVLTLRKAYFYLPAYELKRRAAGGDKFARSIYPVVAYPSLRGLLWFKMTILSAAGLILLSRQMALGYSIIVVVAWLWLIYSWLPNRKVSSFSLFITRVLTPFYVWLFNWAHPALKQLERLQSHYVEEHTQVYEMEDLRRFLRHQTRQPDNRISARQLMRLSKLVSFEEATVSQFTKPWKKSLKLVENDMLGPKLLDEMHHSKQSAFAVIKQKNSHQIVGALSRDAVGLSSEGRVSDYMRTDIESIGHDEMIENALFRFATSSIPLLVVLDKENEAVGTLCLSDALAALLAMEEVQPKKEEPVEVSDAKDKQETDNE